MMVGTSGTYCLPFFSIGCPEGFSRSSSIVDCRFELPAEPPLGAALSMGTFSRSSLPFETRLFRRSCSSACSFAASTTLGQAETSLGGAGASCFFPALPLPLPVFAGGLEMTGAADASPFGFCFALRSLTLDADPWRLEAELAGVEATEGAADCLIDKLCAVVPPFAFSLFDGASSFGGGLVVTAIALLSLPSPSVFSPS